MCLPNNFVLLLFFFDFFLALGLKVVGNRAKMNLDGLNGLRNRKILRIFNNHKQKALKNIYHKFNKSKQNSFKLKFAFKSYLISKGNTFSLIFDKMVSIALTVLVLGDIEKL